MVWIIVIVGAVLILLPMIVLARRLGQGEAEAGGTWGDEVFGDKDEDWGPHSDPPPPKADPPPQ